MMCKTRPPLRELGSYAFMSHLPAVVGSNEDQRRSDYSYNTSDDDKPDSDEWPLPMKTSSHRGNGTSGKSQQTPKISTSLGSKRNKGANNTDQRLIDSARSTLEAREVINNLEETKTRKNSRMRRVATEQKPSPASNVDYAPSVLTLSTIDDPKLGQMREQKTSVVKVFGRDVTYRQMSLICIGCSYLMVFIAGFLLGGLSWNLVDVRDRRNSADDFFSSPWIWPKGNLTVGAYYYPWYSDDFHRGTGYLREQLSPKQEPTLGQYDDSDPNVVYQHLKWSAQANVRLWVTSWWGPGSREDTTTKDVILQHQSLGDHRIALLYETTGRIPERDGYSTENVTPDIVYICQNYFEHPNYFRVDGKPVVFVYLTRLLEELGLLDLVVSDMRQAAGGEGYEIYIVGDHVFQDAPENASLRPPFTILDAVTNYDVYGSMQQPSPYATEEGVREHFQRSKEWKELAAEHNCAFIPSVSPGYNDLGVRPEKHHGPLARQISASDLPGSLFKVALQYGRRLVESRTGNVIMVNSFNEWHEDTQIEPVQGPSTSLPETLTHGIEYQGYGELYLNILREETTP